MDVGHDTSCALATVVDLVNTAPEIAGRRGAAPTSRPSRRWWPGARSPRPTRSATTTWPRCGGCGPGCSAVFAAADDAEAVRLVNSLVADARTTPRLTDHDGWPLHIHYYAPGVRLAEHLAADCGMALAFVIAAGERSRLATCAAPDCARVLVDLSRNRSKRYCDSRTCGNRLHVAAYRARQKTG